MTQNCQIVEIRENKSNGFLYIPISKRWKYSPGEYLKIEKVELDGRNDRV